jgi:hypothetical protein
MKDPRVIDARRKLYQNLYEYGSLKDPGQLVIDNVRKAIHRYVEAFNLKQ